MYLFSYQDIKRIDEQRRARSMAKYRVRKMLEPAPVHMPTREADVIEVTFGTYCDREERMGA